MSRLRPPVGRGDHLRGSLDAPIVLVEFGDFECPFCGVAYGELKRLEALLGDRLCVAFRHFPLEGVHPDAPLAAAAAEAAGRAGRFWEMHDLLYENQRALEEQDLLAYAESLGLDLDRFDEALYSDEVAAKVRADVHSGAVSGVNGTPTIFLNGHRHEGGYDLASLLAAIEREAGREAPR